LAGGTAIGGLIIKGKKSTHATADTATFDLHVLSASLHLDCATALVVSAMQGGTALCDPINLPITGTDLIHFTQLQLTNF
jgi:hypothetical protein